MFIEFNLKDYKSNAIKSLRNIYTCFSGVICSLGVIKSAVFWSDEFGWMIIAVSEFNVFERCRRNLAITIFESADSPCSSYVRSFILYSPSSRI